MTVEEMIEKRNEILRLTDQLYNKKKIPDRSISQLVSDINSMIYEYPEGSIKDSMVAKIKLKYRYAPVMNDTGILDYTGHGRPHFF